MKTAARGLFQSYLVLAGRLISQLERATQCTCCVLQPIRIRVKTKSTLHPISQPEINMYWTIDHAKYITRRFFSEKLSRGENVAAVDWSATSVIFRVNEERKKFERKTEKTSLHVNEDAETRGKLDP